MNNFFLIILDGVGIGELPDADVYGDRGSNTLVNIAEKVGGLKLPALEKAGLGNITNIKGIGKVGVPIASFGKMKEISRGKDSTTGHWEIAGLHVITEFSYFPDGFPEEIMSKFLSVTKLKGYLGNRAASGTEIIRQLGDEHIRTGFPIVYTSADSVFQIAAHEEKFGLDNLYKICKLTRNEVLVPPLLVGRVIARPFIGEKGVFTRTSNRKDYSIDPPGDTILDVLQKDQINTVAIGKVSDLFNYRGISSIEKTRSNHHGFKKLFEYTTKVKNSFIFANLVDFDVSFGHRNDPVGFAKALSEFDRFLEEFLPMLDSTDRLVITADHGNDPTTPSTDHSREYVPLIYFRKGTTGKDLGERETFADVAATVADFFSIKYNTVGKSFLNE